MNYTNTPSCNESQILKDFKSDTLETLNVSWAFCLVRWPQEIPNLSDCCSPNVAVQILDNCTQYCETTRGGSGWMKCVGDLNKESANLSDGKLSLDDPEVLNLIDCPSFDAYKNGNPSLTRPSLVLVYVPILLGVIGLGLGL